MKIKKFAFTIKFSVYMFLMLVIILPFIAIPLEFTTFTIVFWMVLLVLARIAVMMITSLESKLNFIKEIDNKLLH